MTDKNYSNEELYNRIQNETNIAGQKAFSACSSNEDTVQIRPDSSVTRAKIIADKIIPGSYRAHPSTIKAMRKDIFIAQNGIDDLEITYICKSCHNKIDLQFWEICPYCEESIDTKNS